MMSNSEPSERFHAMDAMRAVAMLLGLVFHAGMPFTRTETAWPVMDRWRHPAFDILVYVIHAFRMPLFFIIAGFFAHLLYRKVGPRRFVARRVGRVLLPFVVGLMTIVPLVQAVSVYGTREN